MNNENTTESLDFIRKIIKEDLASNKNDGKVTTRFPPEPNGYLHIGHAKSICLNFGVAKENNSECHLRFDDTNPEKEDIEYVNSIQDDIKWLGFDWNDNIFYASDYFDKFYTYAQELIKKGDAYVCSLNEEDIRLYRGSAVEAGKNSPFRDRPVEENLSLLEKMKKGDFNEGEHVLRAKIDMAHANLKMRDPLMYRIRKVEHYRAGKVWSIYPMYDFAHCLEDAIENITHSICTLEFENNRDVYNWFLSKLSPNCHPQQIEFARLNLTHTVMSKRKIARLVNENIVDGWNDPRLPTLSGLRRKGYTPSSIREFCSKIGVSKINSTSELSLLEHCLRNDLNKNAWRVMGVLDPIKVIIDNYPDDKTEEFDAVNNPEDPSFGTRKVPFSKVIYIERADFREEANRKYFRLKPNSEVRLRYAYFVTCTGFEKNEAGEITEIHCNYDPESRGGHSPDGRKVKGTIHWVSAQHAFETNVNLYDNLFENTDPENIPEGEDFINTTNSNSLTVIHHCKLEPSLKNAEIGKPYQFERLGYFCVDSESYKNNKVNFNRTVSLKASFKAK